MDAAWSARNTVPSVEPRSEPLRRYLASANLRPCNAALRRTDALCI